MYLKISSEEHFELKAPFLPTIKRRGGFGKYVRLMLQSKVDCTS